MESHGALVQTGDSVSLRFQDLKESVGKCMEKAEDKNFGRWKPVILKKSDACKFLLLAKVVFKNSLKMFTLKCAQLNGEVANIKYEVEFCVMSPNPRVIFQLLSFIVYIVRLEAFIKNTILSVKVRQIKWKELTQSFLDVKRLQAGNFLDLDDLQEFYTDKKGTMVVKVGILRRGMDASFTPTVSPLGETVASEVVLCDVTKM